MPNESPQAVSGGIGSFAEGDGICGGLKSNFNAKGFNKKKKVCLRKY